MADQLKVLFISNTLDGDGGHIAKGTIRAFNQNPKGEVSAADQQLLGHFRAGGRIAPVTKENVERCYAELKKIKADVPKELTDALAAFEKK